MKNIWVFIAFFFISGQLRGQQDNQINKLLIESILLYSDYDADLYSKVCKNCGIYTLPYVCKDGLPIDFPYDSLQHISFFTLYNIEGYPNSFKKKLKNGISAWFVEIKLTNNLLDITVSSRNVKRIKKNHIGISIGDWGIFTYEYSCKNQQWSLVETKYGGT